MILLLPLAWLSLFALQVQSSELDWRQALLRSSLLWGAGAIAITEGLSLFEALTPGAAGLAWALICGILIVWLRVRLRRGGRLPRLAINWPDDRGDRLLLAGLAFVALSTAVVALIAPVQTWDSLTYHMTRVAEWAHRGSVRIFPTGIERQDYMSPGAEFAVLQTYLLSQGDRFVNLVNWGASIGILAGVSWIAQLLDASRRGQLLAAIFAASLPLAITQASSTATDLILAFWAVCVVGEAVQAIRRQETIFSRWIYIGLGVGLAILTKPTAYAYLAPFSLWLGASIVRRSGFRQALSAGMAVGLLSLAVNAGYFTRNTITYGTPLGPEKLLTYQASQIYTPSALVSNLVRNASLHLGTIGFFNERLTRGIESLHTWLGIDSNDPRTTLTNRFIVISPRNEDNIGNPLQLLLIAASLTLLGIQHRVRASTPLLYGLCLGSSYGLFSLLYKWQLFGSRLQLPIFVLAAPLFGYLAGKALPARLNGGLGLLLWISALPWILALFPRPLVPYPPYTYRQSILQTPRQELYFANKADLRKPYSRVTGEIQSAGCQTIGLMLKGDDPEYLWWVLLGAARRPLELEWIVAGNASAQSRDPDFAPCAIICTSCPEGDTLRGLPLVYDNRGIRLYLEAMPE